MSRLKPRPTKLERAILKVAHYRHAGIARRCRRKNSLSIFRSGPSPPAYCPPILMAGSAFLPRPGGQLFSPCSLRGLCALCGGAFAWASSATSPRCCAGEIFFPRMLAEILAMPIYGCGLSPGWAPNRRRSPRRTGCGLFTLSGVEGYLQPARNNEAARHPFKRRMVPSAKKADRLLPLPSRHGAKIRGLR